MLGCSSALTHFSSGTTCDPHLILESVPVFAAYLIPQNHCIGAALLTLVVLEGNEVFLITRALVELTTKLKKDAECV